MQWRRHTRAETRDLRQLRPRDPPAFDGGEFIAVDGPHCGLRARLGNGATSLGRSDDNGIALTLDAGVSRRHALVEWVGQRLYLRDLSSTNGTRVNGVLVQGKVGLSHLDVVSLGGTSLQIVFDDPGVVPVYELPDSDETPTEPPV
ncbi:FHA domain-containing protein [Candidatus Fermentibacteria bacterium]|nr:FHA domain-containing protein [Candidatus Fermentibacteria bacterium]